MKIATVTLNPAIDQTVRVDNFRPNAVNRGSSMQFDAGGKGINVASFLSDYGYEAVVTGFLGEANTALFERHFAATGLADHFVRIAGRTRTNVKISDEAQQQTTDINMLGLSPSQTAVEELLTTIDDLAASCDWFVLTGSLPPGVPDDIYATLITRIQAHGVPVALDTSRAALREGVRAGPTVVKPNVLELQQIAGEPLEDMTAIEQAARQLFEAGIELVVISMGKAGALFIDQTTSLQAIPPAVTVKSTVGAGDAMVAGLIAGQAQGLDLKDCARLATAFSVGAITVVGPYLPDPDILARYQQQVTVRQPDAVSEVGE